MAISVEDLPLPEDLPEVPYGWHYELLGDLVEERGVCYGIVQPGSGTSDGVPIVRVNNIRKGLIDTADMLRVESRIEDKFRRSRLRGGEVLLTLVGTLGEVAVVPEKLRGWNVARAVGVIPVREDPGSLWVSICLRSAFIQRCIRAWATTTVQATFNLRDLVNLPIPIPPTTTRQAIASVLGELDEKIELNRRMNETLDQMARALYKSWFVDFDPVHAKAEDRELNLPQPIADLFPDSFEDSELGEIPCGWQVRNLDEVANFLNGLALQKYPPKGERSLPVIKIAQLRAGDSSKADRASADIKRDYVVQDGDILFSWSGSLECLLWAGGPGALNQHLFRVIPSSYPRWFCYLGVHQHIEEFRHIAAGKATTMGHIQRHHLSDAKLAVPSSKLLRAMDDVIQPIVESTWRRDAQSRTIAALRDTLLPKLLSGEIRSRSAERAVAEAP